MTTPSKPLLATLVITLGLTVWALLQKNDDSAVVSAAATRAARPLVTQAANVSPTHNRSLTDSSTGRALTPLQADPFASHVTLTELVDVPEETAESPVPTIAEPPSPPPTAPKLPFKYLGSLNEKGQRVYFLAMEEKVYNVKLGEKITDDYEFTAATGNELTLTYLPLAQTQTLSIEH